MDLILSRYQIDQLYRLINEYPDEDKVELSISGQSGIGISVTATVHYAAGTHSDSRDITDYNRW
jgi:hypothetical protein